MPAMTASASRSIGTAFAETKDVTSIRGMPVAESRSTTSILSSVGMNSGSIWNPSRVPTSQIVTVLPEERALPVAVSLERPPARLVAVDHRRPHLLEPQLEERVRGGELDGLGGAALAPLVALADHVAELAM